MSKYIYLHYEIIYFIIIGLITTLIHYLSLFTLVEVLTLSALTANVFAYLLACKFSYIGHRYRTFTHQQPNPNKSYIRFFITSLAGLGLNESLFYFFSVQLELTYTMAFVATSLLMIPINYSPYQFWSFVRD